MITRSRTRTILTLVAVAMAIVGLTTTSASADVVLRMDFNSNQDSGGDSTTAGDPGLSAAAHNQAGWSSYHANHEVIAEFTAADYDGITVTPDWPNTTDNRARQSIDRGTGNDNNWDDAAGDLNLVTDFIGIDTRTGNGGNGDWDGTTGTPTYMTLALGGLAAGNYDWTSFHHDTEHVFGPFAVWLSTDGGATFAQLDDGVMTDSTTGGSPDSGATEAGPDAYSLPSTYHTSFSADGVNAVVLRFAPYSETAVHRQIWGMNGFVLSYVPSPVGYWNLDETSGAIVQDSSGNGYDGILSADPDPAPLWTTDPGRGNVLEFVPGLDYVDCGPGVSAGQNLTVALWINPADVELMRPISCFDGGDYSVNPGWYLMLRHDDWDGQVPPNVWFRITGGVDPETEEDAWNSGDVWIDECWTPGEWVHMAFTFDEDTDTLSGYINGELAGMTVVPESRSVASDTNPLIMGHGGGSEEYQGLMDEVCIYDVALTESEIWNLVYPITITIDNPGFEDPVLAEDGYTWGDVPGWTLVGGEATGIEGSGVWNVTLGDFDPVLAPEGENVLYTEYLPEGVAKGVAQVLTETFAADKDYTLTVEVGNSNYYYNGGYSIQLLAGGVVIAEDNDTLWPEYSRWATSTVEYTYDPADAALVGQPLEIRLLNLELDKDSPPADEVVGVEFDNVTLSYEPAAPVSLIEDFDALAVGSSMHDVPGWEGFLGNAQVGGRITDTVAYSGTNALEIVGARDDLVPHWPLVDSGVYVMTVMQYVPATTDGVMHFGPLSSYGPSFDDTVWLTSLVTNCNTGFVYVFDLADAGTPLIRDQWVQLRIVMNFDANTCDLYYGDVLLGTLECPSVQGFDIWPRDEVDVIYYDDFRFESAE